MLIHDLIRRPAGWIRRYVMGGIPWSPFYGLSRSLLAISTGLTLLVNPTGVLQPLNGSGAVIESTLASLSLFQVVPRDWLGTAEVVAGVLLLGVATGYRARYTGFIHWWLTFSVSTGYLLIDGGDQLASILTLLLLPVTLTDPRRWHWSPLPGGVRVPGELAWLVASFALGLVRLQVAGVYFHASVAKFAVEQWTDGTALYYWLLHPLFGCPTWLQPVLAPLLLLGPVVTLLTWSVLALEFALAAGLLSARVYRPWLLAGGVVLHSGIIVVHGLVSFGLVMFGALVLFLVPRRPPAAAQRH